MSAVEEYKNVAKQVVQKPGFYTIVSVADAAVAELKAEIPDGWEIDLNARLEKRIADLEAENERLDKMLREACRRWAAGMNARNVMPNRHYIQNAGEGFQELVRWAERETT